MKRIKYYLFAALALSVAACQSPGVSSPDGRICVSFDRKSASFDLSFDGKKVLEASKAQLMLSDSSLAWVPGTKIKPGEVLLCTDTVDAPMYRQSHFEYTYNSIRFDLGTGFYMEWRLSNDGAAYRFGTVREGETEILDETAAFTLAEDALLTCTKSTNKSRPYRCTFESYYSSSMVSEGSDMPVILPAAVDLGEGRKLVLAEADVRSYPGAFVRPLGGGTTIAAEFAPIVGCSAIARSKGARSYPWRIMKLTDNDAQIAEDNLICALSEPAAEGSDWSWVKPGFSAWDWWSDYALEGVSFKPGVNNETYRYLIDFAADNGLEYVTVDEGWGKLGPGRNLLTPIPSLDLEGLAAHASRRGVKLILWAAFERLAAEAENVCERYSRMGIAGFKTDHMNRNDQAGMEKVYRMAETAARYHMVLDMHGCPPLMGICRTWPNIINVEGVTGMAHCKWNLRADDFVAHDVNVAFLRQMAGACDYTPGAMKNMGRDEYHSDFSHPGSQGTRAHQLGLFGVMDAPLTVLCDSPSAYMRETETMDFIAGLPRSFRSKKVLEGRLGEYIVVARETASGDEWCVAGICNWDGRSLDLGTGFLNGGCWQGTMFADVPGEGPQKFLTKEISISAGDRIPVEMLPGGGFYLRLRKK